MHSDKSTASNMHMKEKCLHIDIFFAYKDWEGGEKKRKRKSEIRENFETSNKLSRQMMTILTGETSCNEETESSAEEADAGENEVRNFRQSDKKNPDLQIESINKV